MKVNVPKPDKPDKSAAKPKENPQDPKPAAPPQKHSNKVLPSDPNAYYPQQRFAQKITFLYKRWPPFKQAWKKFIKAVPQVNQKNFEAKFKEATGKKFKIGQAPASWFTRLVSAMHEIERRLEV